MTPREIIAEAWGITVRTRPLRRWAVTAAFFETLLRIKLIGYQGYYLYFFFMRGETIGFFDVEMRLFRGLPLGIFMAMTGILLLLLLVEFFLPHVCTGAIIGLGAKAFRKEEVKGGLVLGIYNFWAIFAIQEFLTLSSLSTVVMAVSIVIRYMEGPMRLWVLGMITAILCFSLFLKFFFSFAEEAVVIQKLGIFASLARSFKLIISHLGHVIFLLLLLFVISLRIIINAIVIILIPAILIGLGLLLMLFLPPALTYAITGIVGLLLIVIASYFFGYLIAFRQTVWTITYLELSRHKDLDVIME
jgi:hypothetical protein